MEELFVDYNAGHLNNPHQNQDDNNISEINGTRPRETEGDHADLLGSTVPVSSQLHSDSDNVPAAQVSTTQSLLDIIGYVLATSTPLQNQPSPISDVIISLPAASSTPPLIVSTDQYTQNNYVPHSQTPETVAIFVGLSRPRHPPTHMFFTTTLNILIPSTYPIGSLLYSAHNNGQFCDFLSIIKSEHLGKLHVAQSSVPHEMATTQFTSPNQGYSRFSGTYSSLVDQSTAQYHQIIYPAHNDALETITLRARQHILPTVQLYVLYFTLPVGKNIHDSEHCFSDLFKHRSSALLSLST